MGLVKGRRGIVMVVFGNLVLVEAQALALSLLASAFAMLISLFDDNYSPSKILHILLFLGATSTAATSIAGLVLGFITKLVILVSHHYRVNPDNVATPVAAALGDVMMLSVLSIVARYYFEWFYVTGCWWWLAGLTLAAPPLSALCLFVASRIEFTRRQVTGGWVPIVCAVLISNFAGLLFQNAKFADMTPLLPIINGVGGNVVAVQASRLATQLHVLHGKAGSKSRPNPNDDILARRGGCPLPNPFVTFFSHRLHSRTARVLLGIALPGHLLFTGILYLCNKSRTSIFTVQFPILYAVAVFLQLVILLYLAHWLMRVLWRFGRDPDDYAIPFLTALGDVLGTAFLVIVFAILYYVFRIGELTT